MREYLNNLQNKPHHHKKRFALLTSGVVTLTILAIWAVVRFGGEPELAQKTTGPVQLAATVESGAFDRLWGGIKDSFSSLKNLISDGN